MKDKPYDRKPRFRRVHRRLGCLRVSLRKRKPQIGFIFFREIALLDFLEEIALLICRFILLMRCGLMPDSRRMTSDQISSHHLVDIGYHDITTRSTVVGG